MQKFVNVLQCHFPRLLKCTIKAFLCDVCICGHVVELTFWRVLVVIYFKPQLGGGGQAKQSVSSLRNAVNRGCFLLWAWSVIPWIWPTQIQLCFFVVHVWGQWLHSIEQLSTTRHCIKKWMQLTRVSNKHTCTFLALRRLHLIEIHGVSLLWLCVMRPIKMFHSWFTKGLINDFVLFCRCYRSMACPSPAETSCPDEGTCW